MLFSSGFFRNINITQRQASLIVLALYSLGAFLLTLIEWVTPTDNAHARLSGGLLSGFFFGGAWFLYLKYDWKSIRYFAAISSTLLVTLSIPEPFVSHYAPIVIIIPAVLALILTEPFCVLINGLITIGILLIRAQGTGVYTEFGTLTLYFMIVGGLIVRQLIGDTSLRQIREAQEKTRQNETRFRRLMENNSNQVSILDADGRLLYETPLSNPILGYKFGEHIGMSVFELVHPDDRERVKNILARLVQNPDFHPRDQFRLVHSDGTWHWVEGVGKNLLGEPSIGGIVINYHDITERVEAEEQIQRRLKQLKGLRLIDKSISSTFDLKTTLEVVLQQVTSLLSVDAAAVLLVNTESQTVEYAASRGFHSQALRYTRLTFGNGHAGKAVLERRIIHIANVMETGGELATALKSADETFADYCSVPLLVKGEVKGVLEIYHRLPLGADPEWLEFLETLAGQAAIAIDNAQLFDSLQSAKEELERRVAERTAELERANRTKDEFLANMSHELRTPLNSILGLSESLLEQRRGSLNEQQQKSLQIIESSGHHLLELINDILDLSKINARMFDFYPQPIALDDFCRSCLAFVKSQAAKKSIAITYIQEPFVSKIFADPRRFKQILVNLLTNAVKFTPAGGHVTLRVNAEIDQDLIQFSVIDNGIGIALDDMQRLFQPFVQLDSSFTREYDGTGLGLALVQKLTDLHGGSVSVESKIGKGSTFTVTIPCRQYEITTLENIHTGYRVSTGTQTAESTTPPDATAYPGPILLAEDNVSSVITISEYLEMYGYDVIVAHDGIEAIEKAESTDPAVILMDIQMPGLNGLEAIARLRGNPRFAASPIIALTALAMPGDRDRCLLAGANDYMSKPVRLKDLKQLIEGFLEIQPTT